MAWFLRCKFLSSQDILHFTLTHIVLLHQSRFHSLFFECLFRIDDKKYRSVSPSPSLSFSLFLSLHHPITLLSFFLQLVTSVFRQHSIREESNNVLLCITITCMHHVLFCVCVYSCYHWIVIVNCAVNSLQDLICTKLMSSLLTLLFFSFLIASCSL